MHRTALKFLHCSPRPAATTVPSVCPTLAEGGTIFLDEIGDISRAMQTRLLRVLQERVYEPPGSVEPVSTNVRVIAATHRNLDDLVREGTFRQDRLHEHCP